MDRAAMAFANDDLPVPEVVEVGDAFDRAYAISARHHGRFLEDVPVAQSARATLALERTLAALRRAGAGADAAVEWFASANAMRPLTWREWLVEGLVDEPSHLVSGWRAALAADRQLDRLYRRCEERIRQLVEECPERRDLVHGDLLNRNVLISEDASRITAVFSWKCSVRGDFLFDVAWCTFWGAWHPGISGMNLWDRTLASPVLGDEDLHRADLRHHCYELRIGASHLGWSAWTGDDALLRAVADHTEGLLGRGPIPPG